MSAISQEDICSIWLKELDSSGPNYNHQFPIGARSQVEATFPHP